MTDQPNPSTQRIGDAERDQATEYLREHLVSGRLDQAEFDDRLSRALAARTRSDLDPLFTDLPDPRPGATSLPTAGYQPPPWQAAPQQDLATRPVAPVPERSRLNSAWAVASGIAWPAAIIFCFATDWRFWWVMLIPVFFPWWLGHAEGDRRRHSHDRHRRR